MKKKEQNKRVQGTRHKVSGPLTRDVGIRIYWLSRVKWTLHHPDGKRIDNTGTISDRTRA